MKGQEIVVWSQVLAVRTLPLTCGGIPFKTTLREKKKATRIYMSLKDETRDEDLPYEPYDYKRDILLNGPALSRSKYVPSTLTIGTKPQTEAATEEDDCTGDSGMGTGSDSAVEDSKSHRKAATDVEDATEKENFYTALREGTKERGMAFMAWLYTALSFIDIHNSFFAAHSYQVLKRGSALREGTKERGMAFMAWLQLYLISRHNHICLL
ncbi:hypothetical protein GBAR_LOCUS31677 [Geodia barretti]|uniref:Uncharacterized protein n=1 Tax=Geodia barretti TaxID=519541 RepID=A0AA35U169_GEOBA|nr:hypothetical protein GBAR_LOCUS31677 [Geodia barretti]